jgi:hypothetical protein
MLKSKSETITEFKLLCPIGEGKEEILVQIPVAVEYLDILGNKNSLSIGSAIFSIRSEKKGLKLIKKLDSIKIALNETISPLKSSPNNDVQSITNGLFSIISRIQSSIEDSVNKGEFVSAELGLSRLQDLNDFIEPLTSFLVKLHEDSNELLNSFRSIRETSTELLKSFETLNNKFIT